MVTGDQSSTELPAADALALIVGRLKHQAMSDGMWEDSRAGLLT